MAASQAVSGFGVSLTWNSNTVSEITNDLGVNPTRNMIDVTSHDSDDSYEEFIPGLKNGGEITVECNYIDSDAGQSGMYADFEAGTRRPFAINLPGTTLGWSGNGYISSYQITTPTTEQLKLVATIKVTGKPTLA